MFYNISYTGNVQRKLTFCTNITFDQQVGSRKIIQKSFFPRPPLVGFPFNIWDGCRYFEMFNFSSVEGLVYF